MPFQFLPNSVVNVNYLASDVNINFSGSTVDTPGPGRLQETLIARRCIKKVYGLPIIK